MTLDPEPHLFLNPAPSLGPFFFPESPSLSEPTLLPEPSYLSLEFVSVMGQVGSLSPFLSSGPPLIGPLPSALWGLVWGTVCRELHYGAFPSPGH